MTYNHSDEMTSRSPEETQSIGRILGNYCHPGDIILLIGDIGTGKTCLTQGILWGLDSEEYARSPTFVIVLEYRGRLKMYHMDLYRLDTANEISELGLDEYLFGDDVCVIEWADKIPDVIPKQHLIVKVDYLEETERQLTLTDNNLQFSESLTAIKSAFKDEAHWNYL